MQQDDKEIEIIKIKENDAADDALTVYEAAKNNMSVGEKFKLAAGILIGAICTTTFAVAAGGVAPPNIEIYFKYAAFALTVVAGGIGGGAAVAKYKNPSTNLSLTKENMKNLSEGKSIVITIQAETEEKSANKDEQARPFWLQSALDKIRHRRQPNSELGISK